MQNMLQFRLGELADEQLLLTAVVKRSQGSACCGRKRPPRGEWRGSPSVCVLWCGARHEVGIPGAQRRIRPPVPAKLSDRNNGASQQFLSVFRPERNGSDAADNMECPRRCNFNDEWHKKLTAASIPCNIGYLSPVFAGKLFNNNILSSARLLISQKLFSRIWPLLGIKCRTASCTALMP